MKNEIKCTIILKVVYAFTIENADTYLNTLLNNPLFNFLPKATRKLIPILNIFEDN